VDQAREQLRREIRPLPRLQLDPSVRSVLDFRYDHVAIEGYDPHPHIKAEVAV
jgi:thymidylate synthase